jgi:hypothetical protein
MKKIWSYIRKYFVDLYNRIIKTEIKIKLMYVLIFIIIIFLSKYIYNFAIDISSFLLKNIPNELHDNKILQFLVLFTPMLFISTVVHIQIPKLPIRILNYFQLVIHIVIELLYFSDSEFVFSNYFYLYLTIDTLYFLVIDYIKRSKRGVPNV